MSVESHATTGTSGADGFRHEALLYAGDDDFVRRTSDFVRDGLEAGEPTLVVVAARKIDWLRDALNGHADRVHFADMADVGHNPARIIPAWREFVAKHADTGVRLRGIGEPVYPERDADALIECQRHESLLNVAFDGGRAWWLLCPYDTTALDPAVIDEALRSHPYVMDGHSRTSLDYRGLDECAAPFETLLPDPPASALVFDFDGRNVGDVRAVVSHYISRLGFDETQTADFALAVHELATNSIRHGGGSGRLRLWSDEATAVAEVSDAGVIGDPLAGRVNPVESVESGRGLWLANHLCDLVQIRSHPRGSIVRAHLARR
jgi:anti-sigma regulatory factor (Ser/Thr protein kinase)